MEKRTFFSKVRELNSQVDENRADEKGRRMADISEIVLRMNEYSDIFSDFDPRPNQKRSLSDDFLIEAQKASREKLGDSIEMRLLFPKKGRDVNEENIIRKRLHSHFLRHYNLLVDEIAAINRHGIFATIIGAAMLAFSTYLYILSNQTAWTHIAYVLLQPAGWFISWYGLDEIFYSSKKLKQDLEFYDKMHRSRIVFDYF